MSFLSNTNKDMKAGDFHVTKVQIHQNVPCDNNAGGVISNATKSCTQSIVRSADLNDAIQIKRRYGSKPLFARDDIAVNQQPLDISTKGDQYEILKVNNQEVKVSDKKKLSTSRSSSTSPERYRERFKKKSSPRKVYSPDKSKHLGITKTSYPVIKYREEDRVRCLYGSSSERRDRKSRSPPQSPRHVRRSSILKEPGIGQRKRTRSRSPYTTKHEKCQERLRKKGSPSLPRTRKASPVKQATLHKKPYFVDKYREEDRLRNLYGSIERRERKTRSPQSPRHARRELSQYSRRSLSRDRRRRHSPTSIRRRLSTRHSRTPRRSRSPYRSRTPRRSRSHSPEYRSRRSFSRERNKYRYSPSRSGLHSPDHHERSFKPTPQYIPIPVPMAPESFAAAYPYPSYCIPQAPAWGPPPPSSHRIPPSHQRPHQPPSAPIIGYPIMGPMVRPLGPNPYDHMSYITVPPPRMQWYASPRPPGISNRANNPARSKKTTAIKASTGKNVQSNKQ